jgi:hypothetical protein
MPKVVIHVVNKLATCDAETADPLTIWAFRLEPSRATLRTQKFSK